MRNWEEKRPSEVRDPQVDLCSTVMQETRAGHVFIYQINQFYLLCSKEICGEPQMQATYEVTNFPVATLKKQKKSLWC